MRTFLLAALAPTALALTAFSRVGAPLRGAAHPRASSSVVAAAGGPLSGAMPSGFELPGGGRAVILFDGVCNFCNAWVSFLLDNDEEGQFCFASLQSERGRELLAACGRSPDDLSTFVLIDGEGFHTQSSAALRVARQLRSPLLGAAARAFEPVPRVIRDSVYRLVANNRYRILGRDSDGAEPSCKLRAAADAELVAERFL